MRQRGRARSRRGGEAVCPILDLTASNPTQCGFRYEANLLAELSAEGARTYDPDPRGMLAAREAVCGYYARPRCARGCRAGGADDEH